MKISLVIPVHNLEKFIQPLLDSLRQQDYDHNEIEPIFVCDCCEDRTHEIIEDKLADSFQHLKILDRQYRSSGLARNDGIEEATGELVWLLDGDDWLTHSEAVTMVIRTFEEKPERHVIRVGWTTNCYKDLEYRFTVWQYVVRSEWAKAVKFTSRPYDDDVEWVKNLMATFHFNTCKKLNEPLYYYNYMREGSVTTERKSKKLAD